MTSKRDLQREVEALSEETASETGGLWIIFPGDTVAAREQASRPELVVPAADGDGFTMAVPNISPNRRKDTVLCISRSVVDTWECDHDAVPAAELWDSMTEEELREEHRLRREHNDAIPPLLEEYEPE